MSKTRPQKGTYKPCLHCGKTYYEWPHERGERKYCSQTCSNRANAKHLSRIRMGPGNPMYGKRPHNYKDGQSRLRGCKPEYWIWKRKVHNRDKNTCQGCGEKLRRRELIAHHIKPWRDYPKLRFKVSNGVTLCRPCHNRIDPMVKANQY